MTVFPPLLSDTDKKQKELLSAIDEFDHITEESEWMKLPEYFDGKTLSYRMERDYSSFLILAIGAVMSVLYGFEDKIRQKEKEKKRKEQLALEYSELVSKLQIYLGAGMTVRTAWERIAKDYERRLSKQEKIVSPAYEEAANVCKDLQSGVSEPEAYRRFGRRCGLRPYMKLASLLEQSRKTGLKNLRSLLDEEVASAYEERRNLAKRQGEEAATKAIAATVYDVGNSHGNRSGAGIFKLLLIKKQEEVKGMKAKEELQAWLTEEERNWSYRSCVDFGGSDWSGYYF